MQAALAMAREGQRYDEVPVGAVVVRQGEIIAGAYNAPIFTHDPAGHAEIRALRLAGASLGNYRLVDCELYVTLEPCVMCAGAIMHARIKRLVYGARDAKTGACGGIVNLFANTGLNHHTEVVPGVLAEEAVLLLQDFFAQMRARRK